MIPCLIRSEERLRAVLGASLLLLGPLLLALLAAAKFGGLTEPQALEHAQLARHLARGDGYRTSVLRPMSVAQPDTTLPAPDRVSAPAYPVLLAAVFAAGQPSDLAAATLGLALWLGSAWLLYLLACYWWTARVAAWATWLYAGGLGGLLAASAGLPQPLSALLVLGAFGAGYRPTAGSAPSPMPGWRLVLAGLLGGGLVLVDYRLIWVPVILGVGLVHDHRRKLRTALLYGCSFLGCLLPWLVRCLVLDGQFLHQLLDNTRLYPGQTLWQSTSPPAEPLIHLLFHPVELVRKLGLGLLQLHGNPAQWLEPVGLFLFVTALVAAPRAGLRWRLGWVVMAGGVLTVLWSSLLRSEPRLLLGLAPLVAAVGAAQWVAWLNTKPLGRWQRGLLLGLVVALVILPTLAALARWRPGDRGALVATSQYLRQQIPAAGLLLTDQPLWTAWHLDRPSLWLPRQEQDLEQLSTSLGSLAACYIVQPARVLAADQAPDWWSWVGSGRGIYRGLGPVPNSPLAGVLRVPVSSSSNAAASVAALEAAVRASPGAAESRVALGFGYLQVGRLREAQAEFAAAGRLDEFSVEALVGQWHVRALLELSDDLLRLTSLLGQVPATPARAQPLLEQLVEQLEVAVARQPADPWLRLNLMVGLGRLGRWEQLRAASAPLAEVLPASLPLPLVLATCYMQQQLWAPAAEQAERLVRAQPTNPVAHYILGRCQLGLGQPQAALEALRLALRLRPRWLAAHLEAGRANQQLQQHAAAADHFTTALQLAPGLVAAELSLADVQRQLGRAPAAIAAYQRVLQAAPNHLVALNNLAALLGRDGQMPAALVLARRALAVAPSHPLVRDTLGWLCLEAGQPAEAIAHLTEAVRVAPDQASSHFHLGRAYLAQQQPHLARPALERALAAGLGEPEKQQAQQTLAMLSP